MDKDNNKKEFDFFTTYNLNFSAVLVAFDVKLHHVDKSQGSKTLFCFEQSNRLQELNDKYWKRELKVEPQNLFDSLKFLKNLIYSEWEGGHGL